MAFASTLRAGVARDAVACGRQVAAAARNVVVRRMGAVAAVADSEAAPLYPEAILKAPETQMGKLSNGVRVASQAGSGPLASLSLSVDVGTRYESVDNNGTCAVLAAAAFKGKEAAIAAMGGNFSAEVDREHVTYSATVLKADVAKAMEVLCAAAKSANVSAETVEAAKDDAQATVAAADANPQLNLMDHLHDAAFLDTSMGLPTIGTASSIAGLTADSVKAFSEATLSGPRVVVAGAGAVHQGALMEASEVLLGGLASTPNDAVEETLEPAHFIGSDKRMRFDSMPDAQVAVAFKGPPAGSEHSMAIMIMKAVLGTYDERSLLGDNAASKWRQDLASMSLAKTASPFYLGYKDAGLIGIKGVVNDNNLDNFMWYSLWNMVYMCHKVTDAEVDLAKVHLKAAILGQTAGCEAAAADIGKQIMQHGRRLSPAEIVARIDSVTAKDVRTMAGKFINDQDHALAAVGPIHELPDYNWIRRRSFWLRY